MKKWKTPELLLLGIQLTKDDIIPPTEQIFKCKYCIFDGKDCNEIAKHLIENAGRDGHPTNPSDGDYHQPPEAQMCGIVMTS